MSFLLSPLVCRIFDWSAVRVNISLNEETEARVSSLKIELHGLPKLIRRGLGSGDWRSGRDGLRDVLDGTRTEFVRGRAPILRFERVGPDVVLNLFQNLKFAEMRQEIGTHGELAQPRLRTLHFDSRGFEPFIFDGILDEENRAIQQNEVLRLLMLLSLQELQTGDVHKLNGHPVSTGMLVV